MLENAIELKAKQILAELGQTERLDRGRDKLEQNAIEYVLN